MRPLPKITVIFSFLLFVSCAKEKADITLPAVISENMLLQQQIEAPIWGWTKPGRKLQIKGSWQENFVKTKADKNGKWFTKLLTPEAGGPYSILIEGDTSISIDNVLIGEVWIGSGQSNMQMPLLGYRNEPLLNAKEEIKTANYPTIRLFHVERKLSTSPLDDCVGKWVECDSSTVANFSAVAYFYGRELHNKLNVPIGLIHTSWGGTPAESWTNKVNLEKFDCFKEEMTHLDSIQQYLDFQQKRYRAARAKWMEEIHVEEWLDPNLDVRTWKKIMVPALWVNTKLGKITGTVWYRKSVEIPQEFVGKNLILELGPIDEMDDTWFNGIKVGSHVRTSDWVKNRVYSIPNSAVKTGKNIILIRVDNFNGDGGIYGKADQLRIYTAIDSAQTIPLAGLWLCKIDQEAKNKPFNPGYINLSQPKAPTVLYNAMINPLIPYSIRGVIWYQGESNIYDPKLYQDLFPNMINNWRDDWNQGEFPFYYVQIAPFNYRAHQKSYELREAQMMSLSVPNSGMAVTMDIGSIISIHPPNKQDVAYRLALWALAKTYGKKDLVYSGPLYKSMKVEGDKIRLVFDHVGSGLKSNGKPLFHFKIAGEDKKFVDGNAIIDGKTVVVSSSQIKNPVAVRYGWSNTAQPNLFNKEGLPASSFRTDDWE